MRSWGHALEKAAIAMIRVLLVEDNEMNRDMLAASQPQGL